METKQGEHVTVHILDKIKLSRLLSSSGCLPGSEGFWFPPEMDGKELLTPP